MKQVRAVYRCRNCGEVYFTGRYPEDNLRICPSPAGLFGGKSIEADVSAASLWDIHLCDECSPKIGVADLVGWE